MKGGWAEVALGDVATLTSGGTPDRSKPEYYGDGVPWITSADIVDGTLVPRTHITELGLQRSAASVAAPDTVLLVTRTGVGKVAVTRYPVSYSQDITAIVPEVRRLDVSYLAYVLRSKQQWLADRARGATVKGVPRDVVTSMQLPLPPVDEQRRIARLLDAAEKLRKARTRAIDCLDQIIPATFRSMFGEISHPRYPVKSLAEILARPLQAGAYFPKSAYVTGAGAGVEMVHMSDAFYGHVRRGALEKVFCSDRDRQKYSLAAGDLLIARRSLNYSGAAKPCFVPSDADDLLFESSLLRARPDPMQLTTEFLYWYLNDEQVRRTHIRRIVTGVTIWGVNQANLLQVPILVPPMELQEKFGHAASAANALRGCCLAHLQHLDSLFACLQARAFTGEP